MPICWVWESERPMGKHSKPPTLNDIVQLPNSSPFDTPPYDPLMIRQFEQDEHYSRLYIWWCRKRGKRLPTRQQRAIRNIEKGTLTPSEKQRHNQPPTEAQKKRWARTTPSKVNPHIFMLSGSLAMIALFSIMFATNTMNLILAGFTFMVGAQLPAWWGIVFTLTVSIVSVSAILWMSSKETHMSIQQKILGYSTVIVSLVTFIFIMIVTFI